MAGPRVLQLLFLLLAALVAAARAESPGDPQVGVLQEVDVSDKDVQELEDFALRVYNHEIEDMYLHKAVRIVRARKQVVYGENFILDIEVGPTACVHYEQDFDTCSLNTDPEDPMDALCSFQVYTLPSENTLFMREYTCEENQRSA